MSHPPLQLDPDAIEALLPQTQCQLCDYPGCKPYAEAIAQGEAIDKCLPGGIDTLNNLAHLTHQDPTPMLDAMAKKTKTPSYAIIREQACIGCTKCIDACPVDAIIGAGKHMHTVLTDHCTGCELCIPPCPVDCIDLIPITPKQNPQQEANKAKQRYQKHTIRLTKKALEKKQQYRQMKHDIQHANPFQQAIERENQRRQPDSPHES
jgi:Na+-translocating ferredoxin:NAD+ oxidoreductase subunit B